MENIMTTTMKTTLRCESGRATGERCEWSGDVSELAEIEWMPDCLRASHATAGNWGIYPHNGAVRLRCCPDCVEMLSEEEVVSMTTTNSKVGLPVGDISAVMHYVGVEEAVRKLTVKF